MRKNEAIYLLCVLICAGLFAARSVTRSLFLLSPEAASDTATFSVAGQSRNVDMVKLQSLLERRALSDHEAEFYEPVGTPRSADRDSERNEPAAQPGQESDLSPP